MPHNSIGFMSAQGELEHKLRGECAGNVTENGFFTPLHCSEFYWVETGAIDHNGVIKLLAPRFAFPCTIGCTLRATDLLVVTENQSWSYSTKSLPGFDATYE